VMRRSRAWSPGRRIRACTVCVASPERLCRDLVHKLARPRSEMVRSAHSPLSTQQVSELSGRRLAAGPRPRSVGASPRPHFPRRDGRSAAVLRCCDARHPEQDEAQAATVKSLESKMPAAYFQSRRELTVLMEASRLRRLRP
jgi:hypothetical protein